MSATVIVGSAGVVATDLESSAAQPKWCDDWPVSSPTPRRRLSRVTGLRRPVPSEPEPEPTQGPETPSEPQPGADSEPDGEPRRSRLSRIGSGVGSAVTWDGWLKLGAVVTAAGVLVGFYFTSNSFQATSKQNEIARQSQVTDRFTKAVAALDLPGQSSRIGGIYSLEQLAKDSPDLRVPIFEVLSEFVRFKAHVDRPSDCRTDTPLSDDLQAALTVIGRRTYPTAEIISLNSTCLPGATLDDANLSAVTFTDSNLTNVSMHNATFYSPYDGYGARWAFIRSNLTGTDLFGDDLHDFHFGTAKLDRAFVVGTTLTDATFELSSLTGTDFALSDLSNACFGNSDLSNATFTDGSPVPVLGNPNDAKGLSTAKFIADRHTETVWPEGFAPPSDIDIQQDPLAPGAMHCE
ncbi:pentapeptide repeat-containing protein [Nocardia sp. NPDC004860]|uniref:pentapeptide repeat-containing protein n=1 Tax=Nocardia sp. NPDC004860 TaxID=3154557 RepID=UPI0033A7D132